MDKDYIEALPTAVVGAAQGAYKYYLKDYLTPAVGWGLVAAGVVAWDLFTPKTLTSGAHEALNIHPILTRLAIGAVALHLAAPKISPVDILYGRLK